MFSENGKISQRQLYRMIIVATLGPSLLICPRLLGTYGGLGFVAYLLATLISGIYIFVVLMLKGIASDKPLWNVGRGIFCSLASIRLIAIGVGGLYTMLDVVKRILLPKTNSIMILLLVGVLLVYWLGSGFESTARAMELLFYWVLIPIVISLAVAIPNVELKNFLGGLVGSSSGSGISSMVQMEDISVFDFLVNTFIVFIIFTPAELVWLCSDGIDISKVKKTIWKGFCFFWIANVFAYGIILGIYGMKGLNVDDNYPLIKVMQISGVPGDFLRRVDGFMGAFLVVSIFCGVALALVILKRGMEVLPDYLGLNCRKE